MQGFIRRPPVRWSLVALLLYTLTTLALTYPVPFHLNTVIAGFEYEDAYQVTWSIWWAKEALLDPGKGLTHLTLLNHPAGMEQPLKLTMIGLYLQALPFVLLLSPATAYNLQVLLSFILTGMTTFWLCSEWAGDRRAGLVGGFIFAFFLNKTGHVLAGHLPQVMVYWIPLYALFLRRTLRRPGWRKALPAALVLVPACLVHLMHLAYLVLPVTVAVLLIAVVEMKGAFFTRQRLGALALVFGLAALVTGPFLLPAVLDSATGATYVEETGIIDHSTDLLAFIAPSPYHPLLDRLGLVPPIARQVFQDEGALREGLASPGFLAIALALWGLVRRWRTGWIWGALALLAVVLSLGPLLKVGGTLVSYQVEGEQSHVVLPYALLRQVPFLEIGRTPGRLNGTAMFALAVLASYGTAALSSRLAQRQRALTALLALFLIGMGIESVAFWPFPTGSAEIPPTIRRIASEPGDGALLHMRLPWTQRPVNHRSLYYQTVALRPIVDGFVHRTPLDVPPWSETLLGLVHQDQAAGDVVPRPDAAERVAWLRHFDVDYVVFHRFEPENETLLRDFVQALLGQPRYEEDALTAFQIPEGAPAPQSPLLYTLSQEGWHPPESDGLGWRRWMAQEGRLYVYSTKQQVGALRFTVSTHLDSAVLQVLVADEPLDALVVSERTTYTTRPFTLTRGMNVLRFQATGDCPETLDNPCCWAEGVSAPSEQVAAPLCTCDPGDVRTTCRTFVFDHISLVPRQELADGEALDISFGDQMRLRGWTINRTTLQPGEMLTLTLSWEPTVALSDRHVVFVHLLSPDEALAAQDDAPPVTRMPTAAPWSPGTTFHYSVTLQLPADLAAGEYRLVTGVYLWPSLERLPVLAEVPGAETNVVELGVVEVRP